MATKKDLEELIIRVDERTMVIPNIEKHLRTLNDNVADVTRANDVTRTIADQANKKADNNSRNFFRFLIAFCICLVAMVCGLGIPMWVG